MTSSFWSQLLEGPLGPNVLVVQWVVPVSRQILNSLMRWKSKKIQEYPVRRHLMDVPVIAMRLR